MDYKLLAESTNTYVRLIYIKKLYKKYPTDFLVNVKPWLHSDVT